MNELESVEYLQNLALSSFSTPVTLNTHNQRLFTYSLIGRQCNYTWTIFKKIDPTNSTFENIDTDLNLCIPVSYPSGDTNQSDDSGQ